MPRAGGRPSPDPRIEAQFQNILIRAVGYCPPVDITFGAFLRTMIVQRRRMEDRRWVYGGSTVVIDSAGGLRYVILKNVMRDRREQALRADLDSAPPLYSKFFGDAQPPKSQLLRHLHASKAPPARRRNKA